jgi:hypothetical protein
MKDRLIKLNYCDRYDEYASDTDNLFLCRSEMNNFFDFPDVKSIVIRLSKKSHKGAYKIHSFNGHTTGIGQSKVLFSYQVDRYLTIYGLPCYASLEY